MFEPSFHETDEGMVVSVTILYVLAASVAYYENAHGIHATIGLRFGHLEFAPTLSLWNDTPAPLPLWISKIRSAIRRALPSR